MTNNLKRQVEVQGTKKLDRVKGVQALELRKMREVDGGNWGTVIAVFMLASYLYNEGDDFIKGFKKGYNE